MSEPLPLGDLSRLASLLAHQLRAPVGAADGMLRTLLGEYAGPLNPVQHDLLSRAERRLTEALDTAGRILAIANPSPAETEGDHVTELSVVLMGAQARFADLVSKRGISITCESAPGPAWVKATEPALVEALNALISNAIKYTPDHGMVRLSLTRDETDQRLLLSVADSGIGVAEDEREHVFDPFYRATTARDSSRAGVGLGLAFVRSIVLALGGTIEVGQSDLGGADFRISLPEAGHGVPSPAAGSAGGEQRRRVVIVGGVAAGPKVASKIIRLQADTDVTVVDRGDVLSYAGCGFPYYVSGVVKEQKELLSTAVGVVRDPVFFQSVKNVKVFNGCEALSIDRPGHRVRIRRQLAGEDSWLSYDTLVLATGARSIVPDVPGVDLANVFTLHGVHDAEGIRAFLADGKAHDVVIIGGGLLGVEITEALVSRGCRVTIIERLPQILRILDADMAKLVENHLEQHGVRVLTGVRLEAFTGDGRLESVHTDAGHLHADLAVLATGVRPETILAEEAGLVIGETGAIEVDAHMRTSDPTIYAVGDCCQNTDLLTGLPCYVPLGSTANKHGRVAAINICGGEATFPGVLASSICKVFDYGVARTGLTEEAATAAGFDVVTALTPAPDREHFMPNAKTIMLKLVVDRKTRRILGVQGVGQGEVSKRIDVAATAITGGLTVDQVSNLDLCYAPPYSAAIDNIGAAANVALNKLDGMFLGIGAATVNQWLSERRDFIFLDVRNYPEHARVRLPGSTLIPLGTLRGRLAELPKDRVVVTFCSVGLKGYEAALILQAAGFDSVRVLDGGLEMWPYERIEGIQ